MKHCVFWASLFASLVLTAAAYSGQPHIAREGIEWCDIWITQASETKLPRVLLIGDSITRGYYGKVAETLDGKACVARLTTSKSIGDPALLAEVALVVGQYPFQVIHFNNGLHGFGYTEEEYRAQFPELLTTIRKHAPGAKLIWATTTPVRTSGDAKSFAPQTERVKVRNEIARQCTSKEGIAVNDLFGLVENHPEYFSGDGVHLNAQGIAVQAEQVVRKIQEALK